MHPDPVIEAMCRQLVIEHGAHTILLYGSRANGTHTPDSDYDIAAFAPVSDLRRVTGVLAEGFSDIFVYPEATLQDITDDLLRLRGSTVLLQRGHEGAAFLDRLEGRFLAGPAKLSITEERARKDWLVKMAARSRRGDPEGNFRRAWLLTSALEDYFVFRQAWFQGPKKALAWLSVHDRKGHALFVDALAPESDTDSIDRLVQHVIEGVQHGGKRDA
jgi:hypothetical protein